MTKQNLNHKNSTFTKFDRDGNIRHDYNSLADSITSLPVLSSSVIQLVSFTEKSNETDIDDVLSIINDDQSLTSHVLRVANASKYAKMVKSDTLTDAIQLLGLEKVRDVALASSFMGNLLDPYSKGFDWQAFWEHSISVGIISSLIAKFLGREDFEKFYTAGLLHDMGKVGAFCLDEKNMLFVAKKAREHKISMLQAELMTEAPRHDLLGHAICERWNLPEYIGQVCRNHHTVSRDQRNLSKTDSQNEFIDVVILANHLVRKIGLGYSGHNSIENGIEEVLEYLGLDDQDLKEIEELAKNEIKQSGGMMELLA